MALFWTIILLTAIQPSYQIIYQCNPNLVCGCSSNPASVDRIVGGEEASEATWGWAVSISFDDTYLCGGSIISHSWILTAAHCVHNKTQLPITVYAGSNIGWSGSQSRIVSKVIIHSEYKPSGHYNDIALLKLTSPLDMNDPGVSPICLPRVNSTKLANEEWPPTNISVVAVGWGRRVENGPFLGSLQQVTLQTIDYQASTCSVMKTDRQTQLCAGVSDQAKDTCQGDSGGPLLMFTTNNQWVLAGITSFGIGCAQEGFSGVYTRVAAFENWIKENVDDSHWVSGVNPSSATQSLRQTLTNTDIFSFIAMLHDFVSLSKSGTFSNTTLYSHATILVIPNYHKFLYALLIVLFYFIF